jgi:hypothetical protein
MRAALTVVVLGALVLVAPPAHAHQSSVSYHDITVNSDGDVEWTVRLSSRDLYEALGLERDRDASDAEIDAGAVRLSAYVTARLGATVNGRPCPLVPGPVTVKAQAMRFVELRLVGRCPEPPGKLGFSDHLFFDLDPRHSALVQVRGGGQRLTEEFSKTVQYFEWEPGTLPEGKLGLLGFIAKGMEHIYSGTDHIAFLIGLLLVAPIRRARAGWEARPLRPAVIYVLQVVTAFTVAHSATLILAALDVIALPSRFVESAIAASIVAIAVENLVPREPRNRWPLAFLFGLVHGMGFAAMLRPLLPADEVVVPLVAFNVGVELGQLTIVAAVLPVLLLAARAGAPRYRRLVVVGGSALVGVAGAVWLVQRVAS